MKKFAVSLIAAALVTASLFSATALAADFTPSVENKGAPTVTMTADQSGQQVAAVILDADGNEVIGVPTGDLIVTPIAQAQNASSDIRDKLESAYSQIQGSGSLDELASELISTVESFSGTVGVEDLVVRDLFDISVYGTYADYLAEKGNTITITFALGLNPDDFLAVLHNYSGTQWEVIPDERVERHPNGNVSVTFDSLSPVAFVVEQSAVTIDPNGPDSPQTGEPDRYGWLFGAVALTGAAAVCLVKARKKD